MAANCDGRYPHYLLPLADREPPDRVICVDVEAALVGELSGRELRTERFSGWSAVCLRRAGGRLGVVYQASGRTTAGFWLDLAGELGRPGSLWIVSYQCTRTWSLLGMWAELEEGRARISGGDHRAVQDHDTYGRASKPGLLVAEDPPCLAQIRVGHQPGSALWLDVRNWGIDLDPAMARGKPVAERIAHLVQRIDVLSAETAGAPISPTVAGQAWRGWRATIASRGVHCHAHPEALALERSSHIGGRCEVMHMGLAPWPAYHLDFRSHYGAIMADEGFPVRLRSYTSRPDPKEAAAIAWLGEACARVTILTDEAAYPYPRDGDVIYPVGRFTCTLCGPELRDAVERGRVAEWYELAEYDMGPDLLKFAASAYAERHRNSAPDDREIAAWCKSLINALPGKLGHRRRCWETVPGGLAPEPWGEWHQLRQDGTIERWRALGGVCQREVTGGYGPDAVPAIAAWITSHGRFRLLQAIRIAGRENVAYVDTDALVVSGAGLERLRAARLVSDGSLGKLELRAGPIRFEAMGIKHYREGDDVKCAGHTRGVSTVSEDGRGQWYTPAAAEGSRRGTEQGDSSVLQAWPVAAPYRHGRVMVDGMVKPLEVHDGG